MTTPLTLRFGRLRTQAQRYGVLHAGLSYFGRRSWGFWRCIGPALTRWQIREWIASPRPRAVLNLGGGGNCMSGALTLDVDPHADAYLNLLQPLPFPEASADRIFAEEVIEHVPLAAGRQLLRECYRVLEPGGVLRLSTPDPEWFFNQALASDAGCDTLNEIFYGHFHRYIYTRSRLQAELRAAGFLLRESYYRDPASRLGYLDSHPERFQHPAEISQYVEAEKPVAVLT